jgi:transcriptional regulator with XRE-family HTH domain
LGGVNSVLVEGLIAMADLSAVATKKKRPGPGEGIPEEVRKREGELLRALWTKHAKRSQADFAEDLGFTQGVVSQLFAGIRPLNALRASQFAKELGVEVQAFSPRLAREIAEQSALAEWPFERITPERYFSLTRGQRIAIEGRVLGEIVDIEESRRKKV